MTNQLFRPTVFLLLVVFAFSSAGGEPPEGTVRTEWTPPTETGVGWDSGDYAYDDSGNIVSIGRDKFAYDGVNRLKAGSVNAHGVVTSQSFGYDRYGNLLGIATTIANGSDFPTTDGVTFTVSAATNRLDSVCHPTRGCETWTYDDDTGNLTRNQKRIGATLVYDVAYDWDPAGAMTELDSGNAHERYIYDANDERVVMVSLDGDDEIIRRWTWRDGTNKVAREAVEHVGADRWTEPRDYVYRNGSLLAALESSNAAVAERHYHVDHLGTPRLITDAGRHKLAIEVYLPFGERAPGGEAAYIGFKERMRFTGHERDGDGSPYRPMLDYMHARYYTPEWGRFLSVDPAGTSVHAKQPQTWNRYAYSLNNPVNRVDPDGQRSFLVARNGPANSAHMFIVTHARYVGDPNAVVRSFGKSSEKGREGNVGRVGLRTTGLSEGTYAEDVRTWNALAKTDSESKKTVADTDYIAINATDGKVASVADSVIEDNDYDLDGPNSNSASQAIADRAQGSPVGTPDGYYTPTGVDETDKIKFDEQKIKEDELKGLHEYETPPL